MNMFTNYLKNVGLCMLLVTIDKIVPAIIDYLKGKPQILVSKLTESEIIGIIIAILVGALLWSIYDWWKVHKRQDD